MEKHFTPRYRPCQQRIAFLPDGDLVRGLASGKASVVTDTIDAFTENGGRLASGAELEADIMSPPRGSTCRPAAASLSRWTAARSISVQA